MSEENEKEEINEHIKNIAIWRHAKYTMLSIDDKSRAILTDWVRITEFVEVEFPPLSSAIVNPQLIEILETDKKKKMAEHTKDMLEIDEAIKSLLVIEHLPEDLPDLNPEGTTAQDAQSEESDRV